MDFGEDLVIGTAKLGGVKVEASGLLDMREGLMITCSLMWVIFSPDTGVYDGEPRGWGDIGAGGGVSFCFAFCSHLGAANVDGDRAN